MMLVMQQRNDTLIAPLKNIKYRALNQWRIFLPFRVGLKGPVKVED